MVMSYHYSVCMVYHRKVYPTHVRPHINVFFEWSA